MKSILLCEGKTDADFFQYYMRKVHQWEDGRAVDIKNNDFKPKGFTFGRMLIKENDELFLIALNGCGDIINGVKEIFEYNIQNRPTDIFKKIVFVTDNDDENSISDRVAEVGGIIREMSISCGAELENAKWIDLHYRNVMGEADALSGG